MTECAEPVMQTEGGTCCRRYTILRGADTGRGHSAQAMFTSGKDGKRFHGMEGFIIVSWWVERSLMMFRKLPVNQFNEWAVNTTLRVSGGWACLHCILHFDMQVSRPPGHYGKVSGDLSN